jgi:hypothetical protein
MYPTFQSIVRISLSASALFAFVSLKAVAGDDAGVVRISDRRANEGVVIRANNGSFPKHNYARKVNKGLHIKYDKYYAGGYVRSNDAAPSCDCWSCRAKNAFGFLHPSGCGGAGCPPFGWYQMVYPVDPHYFDARDGKVYATGESGVPMVVPLAPVVRYQYNYGWGVPSSRLTPISRTLP